MVINLCEWTVCWKYLYTSQTFGSIVEPGSIGQSLIVFLSFGELVCTYVLFPKRPAMRLVACLVLRKIIMHLGTYDRGRRRCFSFSV